MLVPVTPVGKPRMTQSDRWEQRPAVMRYRQFCDDLRAAYPRTLPDQVSLTFYIPMPKSWSKRKKAEMVGKPHQSKPDIDNLCKSVLDALCEDDSYVWRAQLAKYWAEEGAIDIRIATL